MNPEKEKIIELSNISKFFGHVTALKKVNFELYKNEVLGLLGDNAAGKSTLIKIISGALIPDEGEIKIYGKKVKLNNPYEARNLGIETIYQDLALFDNLDVLANIFSGREIFYKKGIGRLLRMIDRKTMYLKSREAIDKLLVDIPGFYEEVKMFSGGQRQSIAIAKTVYWGNKIIIMDEPTAALGVKETGELLNLIKNLKKHGISVIVIMHNIDQVMQIADRAIILRRGQRVGTIDIVENDSKCREEIIRLMI